MCKLLLLVFFSIVLANMLYAVFMIRSPYKKPVESANSAST